MSRDATDEELAEIEEKFRHITYDLGRGQIRRVADMMISIHTKWEQPRVVELLQRLKRELTTE